MAHGMFHEKYVGYEGFRAVIIKSTTAWDVMLCTLLGH
jgi:hypothetical protein